MTEIGSFQRAGRSAVDRLLRKQEASGSNPDRSILNFSDSPSKRNEGFFRQTFRQEVMNIERLSPYALALSASSLSMNRLILFFCVIMRIDTHRNT